MYYIFKLSKKFYVIFSQYSTAVISCIIFMFLFLVPVQFFYQIIWSFSIFPFKPDKPGATYCIFKINQVSIRGPGGLLCRKHKKTQLKFNSCVSFRTGASTPSRTGGTTSASTPWAAATSTRSCWTKGTPTATSHTTSTTNSSRCERNLTCSLPRATCSLSLATCSQSLATCSLSLATYSLFLLSASHFLPLVLPDN